jgi:hypothetical protein
MYLGVGSLHPLDGTVVPDAHRANAHPVASDSTPSAKVARPGRAKG